MNNQGTVTILLDDQMWQADWGPQPAPDDKARGFFGIDRPSWRPIESDDIDEPLRNGDILFNGDDGYRFHTEIWYAGGLTPEHLPDSETVQRWKKRRRDV